MKRRIRPVGNKILVKTVSPSEEEIKNGIIIPDTAREQSQEARIISLGNGTKDKDENYRPFDVKVNDIVFLNKYGGTEFEIDGCKYKVIKEEDILATIE